MKLCIGIAALVVAATLAAQAQSMVVSGNHETRVIKGQHIDAVVNGNHDEVTLVGHVDHLVISGNHCYVRLRASGDSEVMMNGNHNTMVWSHAARHDHPPRVVDHGNGNTFSDEP